MVGKIERGNGYFINDRFLVVLIISFLVLTFIGASRGDVYEAQSKHTGDH